MNCNFLTTHPSYLIETDERDQFQKRHIATWR